MTGTPRGRDDWSDPDEPDGADGGAVVGGDEVDPRLQAGVEHLQRAAKEAIAATRALLDVAEELVDDPRAVRGVLGALGTVAGAAGSIVGRGRGRGPDDDDPGVQRIPVS
jgi:hypothetical protein